MGRFFRDNWVWIVVPMVLVPLVLVAVWWLTEEGEAAPFVYNVM